MLLRIDKMIFDSGKHIVRSGMGVGVGRGVHGGGAVMATGTQGVGPPFDQMSARPFVQSWLSVAQSVEPVAQLSAPFGGQ